MERLRKDQPIPGYRTITLPDCCMTCHFVTQDYDGNFACLYYVRRNESPADIDANGWCDRFKRGDLYTVEVAGQPG